MTFLFEKLLKLFVDYQKNANQFFPKLMTQSFTVQWVNLELINLVSPCIIYVTFWYQNVHVPL